MPDDVFDVFPDEPTEADLADTLEQSVEVPDDDETDYAYAVEDDRYAGNGIPSWSAFA